MNETLTSSYLDFYNMNIGPQDEAVFSQFLEEYNCITEDSDPNFLQTCQKYCCEGRLVYLGYA